MNKMGNKILINEIWYNSFSNTRKERVKQLLVKHVRASGKNDENNKLSTMHATGLLPTCVQFCTHNTSWSWGICYMGRECELQEVWGQIELDLDSGLVDTKTPIASSHGHSNIQFSLSLCINNMARMSPSVCTKRGDYAQSQGTWLPWGKHSSESHEADTEAPLVSYHSLPKPMNAVPCEVSHLLPKETAKVFMVFLCLESFREKKALLAPKAHLDYQESQ